VATNSFIAPSSPLDRRHLGKYEVLCRLSTGGMSAIYLAHQTGLAGFKKLVVLKTILPDIGGEEDFVGMFLEEARITAAFNHPNIAQVFELDTGDGQLFMAMEFVQGCTLVEMARACRQAKEAIPVGFTLSASRDTALALHYAHNFTDARGRKQIVIHRDVAEKNIMVTYEGVTKLLDFGIAKALGRSGRTSIGMVKGTSGYMSPEQIRGEPLDPRSDIFALGVVMHECLTGLRLFHGKTAEEGMMAALREEVQPPSRWNKEVSPELDAVVLKALQRDRDKRFNTALEFARAIEKAAPTLLWHPEQLGEVVTRHFGDRRTETRRLLESAEFGAENTGEMRVQSVMAKVRASANLASADSPRASPEPARKPSLVTAPRVSMPPEESEFTRPGVLPGATPVISGQRPTMPKEDDALTRPGTLPSNLVTTKPSAPAEKPDLTPPAGGSFGSGEGTSPARPRALRAPPNGATPSSVTSPQAVLQARQFDYDDDDDAGDKTIPAAALPDEIKNLRAQFLASKKNGLTKESAAVAPAAPAAPPVESPPVPQAPLRTTTGETISITNKGAPLDWEDDDGAKTAIAKPGELPGQAVARLRRNTVAPQPFTPDPVNDVSAAQLEPVPEDEDFDSSENLPPLPKERRVGLILAFIVLAMLAVAGLLVLLDIIPLPRAVKPMPVGVVMPLR
jgi:serine/threonine protein kinase